MRVIDKYSVVEEWTEAIQLQPDLEKTKEEYYTITGKKVSIIKHPIQHIDLYEVDRQFNLFMSDWIIITMFRYANGECSSKIKEVVNRNNFKKYYIEVK